jgi:LuxR family maltose regulon positive regulatory protein
VLAGGELPSWDHGFRADGGSDDERAAPGFGIHQSALQPPPARPWLVRREKLLRRLVTLDPDVPLVLLVAPAGYGKTTVLAQWAARLGRWAAWVTVTDEDDDPARLLGHIVEALHVAGLVDVAVWRAYTDGASIAEVVLPRLVASLDARREPVLLVLDEAERLRSRLSRRLIRALAMNLSRGSHIAVASSHRDTAHIGLMRSEHRCVELTADDLAFDEDETRLLFDGLGFDCPDEAVGVLVRRTEGWPVGLSLAALSLRGRADAAAADWNGDDTYVVEYIRDVLLDAEPDSTVRFLLHTAPLERLSGPLCDAVLGSTGSARILLDLANRSRFVIPMDRYGEWYRYHPLVAAALRAGPWRREAGQERVVLERAAAWFAASAMPREAIAHAAAGGARDTVSELVATHARPLVHAGRYEEALGWLDMLGEDLLFSDPRLALLGGWLWAYSGAPARALRAVEAARRGPQDLPPPDGAASMASAIAVTTASMAPFGVERMLVDARTGFDLEPPGSPWHPLAAVVLGVAQLLNGAPGVAANELGRAVHVDREQHRPAAAMALAQLALLAVDRGDWVTAELHARESCAMVEAGELSRYLPSSISFSARARVAARSGDEPAARRCIAEALRLCARPSLDAFPWLGVQVSVALGHAYLDLSDVVGARGRAEEACRHLARLLTKGVLAGQLDALLAEIGRADPADGARAGTAVELVNLTAAELRVLELLPTHLNLADIGDELYISRNTVKTHVAAIYRKLGALSRGQAVRHARELGLL